ncbi:MAG: hypothetical protein AAGF67_06965, partial [Verrucomicrobiota bacterium]
MDEVEYLIDPDLSLRLVKVFSWILILMGAGKILVYAIGEWIPAAYTKVKSEKARNFLTGKGNR